MQNKRGRKLGVVYVEGCRSRRSVQARWVIAKKAGEACCWEDDENE